MIDNDKQKMGAAMFKPETADKAISIAGPKHGYSPPRARFPVTQALEGFLQALSAGPLIGAVYGLMCVRARPDFGVVQVINFAQGDFMMLGMYAAFYFFTALGVQATLATPSDRSSRSCWPARCWLSLLRLPDPDLARIRHAHFLARGEGRYAQLF